MSAAARSDSTWRRRSRSTAQGRVLGLARIGLLDLPQLELEQVELALAPGGALAQLVQRALERADLRMCGGGRRAPRGLLGPAGGVEHLELRRGEREPAVLVLPVEGDERLGELAQIGQRWRSGR